MSQFALISAIYIGAYLFILFWEALIDQNMNIEDSIPQKHLQWLMVSDKVISHLLIKEQSTGICKHNKPNKARFESQLFQKSQTNWSEVPGNIKLWSSSLQRSNPHEQHQTKSLNKILNSRRVHTEVVTEIDNPQNNQNVLPYLNPKIRFPKPYLENTKFVDLISRNKNLLRRGLFDLPLEDHTVIPKSKSSFIEGSLSSLNSINHLSTRQQKFIKYSSAVKREIKKLKQQDKITKKQKHFHSTIETCSEEYHRLLTQSQRNPFSLRNSMHRILAAETINESIEAIPFSKKKQRPYKKLYHF